MHWIKIGHIEHNVQKNTNILLNQHQKEDKSGEMFCSKCSCVWPCPTRILIEGYSALVQSVNKMSFTGEK